MKSFLINFLVLFVFSAYGQIDSFQTIKPIRHTFLPTLNIVGVNVLVNRFDVYVKKVDWAKVSLNSWKNNINNGFAPDNDNFSTNFFAHPYHGSTYFNASRSTGNSFWASIPYTIGGSLMWEYFGETERPSIIDINTTTLGGIYLGEMTHRISKHLLRDHKNRKYKTLRSISAIALNPIGNFNRLLYNDIDNTYTTTGQEQFEINSQLSLGINQILRNVNNDKANTVIHVNYSFVYGNLFAKRKNFKPFDSFVVRAWADIALGKAEDPILINVASQANLIRLSLNDKHAFSVSGHYDFINNQIFKIGNMAGTADYTIFNVFKNWSYVGTANMGLILFGSTNSQVVNVLHPDPELDYIRNYVFGRGIVYKMSFLMDFKKYGKITSMYNKWIHFIKNDASGRESTTIFQLKYYYPITDKTSVGIELFNYRKDATYEDIPSLEKVKRRYSELKFLATRSF